MKQWHAGMVNWYRSINPYVFYDFCVFTVNLLQLGEAVTLLLLKVSMLQVQGQENPILSVVTLHWWDSCAVHKTCMQYICESHTGTQDFHVLTLHWADLCVACKFQLIPQIKLKNIYVNSTCMCKCRYKLYCS